MKITNPVAIVLVCLLAQVSGKPKNFSPPGHGSGNGTDHIQTAANFDSAGAKMEVCPTGDCQNGKFMRLTVTSLTEVDATGTAVTGKKTTDFNAGNSDWTEIKTTLVGNVNVSSTTFASSLAVGQATVGFTLTASIPQGDLTVTYGSQTLTVPAGALKFTVGVADWQFTGVDNGLELVIKLEAKGPKGKGLSKPTKKAKGSDATAKKLDRVDFGDSMFMDAPTFALIDDTNVETALLNSSVVEFQGGVAFKWVFPHFTKKLYYDPVLGDDSTNSSGSTSSSGSNSTDATGSSSASKLLLSYIAAVSLTVLLFGLF
ncbi:hypothetical protein P3T76_013177 [Phytophthora citrophthora]|uniref:Uncharacterized protein n=1 Tax=Phytophthora citrophthora TaxID=4793 RepID=A0AAD9G457_9STRA|nr:hypothetical protein P3T76_013177 [Phytophthora citrophthora]